MVSSDSSERETERSFVDKLLCRRSRKDCNDQVEERSISLKEMFRYATRTDIACIVFGSIFAVLGGIVQPLVLIIGGLITGVFLKEGEKRGNDTFSSDVNEYLVYMGVCGILALIFCFLQSFLLRLSGTRITESIRFHFLQAVVQQDSEWFDCNNSGSINSQLNENIDCISDGIGDKIGMLLRGFSMFISSAIICLIIDWRLTLIAITMGPITTATLALMAKVVAGPSSKILENQNDASNLVEESIMNVKTVGACNAQKHFEKKYSSILKKGLRDSLTYHFWIGFFEGITFFEIYVVIGITLWYGIIGFHSGFIEQRSVLLITSTISLTAYYLGLLGPHLTAIMRAKLATAAIYKTIDRKETFEELRSIGIHLSKPEGNISFSDVYFTYPTRQQPVLKGLSFEVNSGESIALVGHSGCGKSTTIGILTRLYDLSEGTVTIDGIAISDINVESLRKNIGIVQQEPCLFNGTIMDNIRLGRESISDDRAREAARLANAHEFIQALESGYDTFIGAGGISLSGGQKQRIAIARAIATDPKILLLDEATSALDTESERIVQAAIKNASVGRTTIMIAHRLSTLKDVDRIYVISDGRVEEIGTHDKLIELNGPYAALAKAQEIQQEQNPEPYEEKTIRKISMASSVITVSDKFENRIGKKIKIKKNKASSGLWLIYSNMAGHYGKFIASIFFSCLRGAELPLLLVTYYITFQALQISNHSYKTSALNALYVAIGCGVIVWFGQSMQYLVSGWCAECIAAALRLRCLRSLLNRPIDSFDSTETSPQSSVAIMSQHPANVMGALDFRFTLNTGNLFSVLVGLSLAYVFSWEIGLLGTGLCILLLIAAVVNIKVSHKARHEKEKEDRSAEYAIEIVEQTRTIQLLCVEKYFLERYSEQQRKARKYDKKISLVDSLNFGVTQSFVFFCDLICYALGTYFIYTGRYDTQTVFFAFMGSQVSGWSVMYSAPWFPEIIKAASSARILFTLIDNEKLIELKRGEGEKPAITGDVRVDNVTFAYPSRKSVPVSKNLNFFVKSGQKIALVGPSGCGKSTIINLLERFYDTDSGKVIVDSNNVLDLNLEYLRNNIALVGQEPVLFKGSIFENITMGLSEELISMENVVQACRVANAQKFVESFPEGYETDVGERGKSLSGGQKQRIAIARAVIRNPKILLLDEATSALDTESEEVVQKALNDASNGRTCITIAHRLSSIQNSDRIYYIEKGSVFEYGTHDELLSINGKYAKLVRAQCLSK